MRKILGFFVMSLVVVLPLSVSAASITPTCGEFDSEGIRTCVVTYNNDVESDSITVLLAEQGGAEILDISGIAGGEFSLVTSSEENNVWTAVLSTIDPVIANYDILTFKYKNSGTDDCKIKISIGDISKEVGTSSSGGSSTTDEPGDQKETGATLPYITLGTIGVVAVGIYFSTKNKTKMYKI